MYKANYFLFTVIRSRTYRENRFSRIFVYNGIQDARNKTRGRDPRGVQGAGPKTSKLSVSHKPRSEQRPRTAGLRSQRQRLRRRLGAPPHPHPPRSAPFPNTNQCNAARGPTFSRACLDCRTMPAALTNRRAHRRRSARRRQGRTSRTQTSTTW